MTNLLRRYIYPFFFGALLTVAIVGYTTLTYRLNPKLLIIIVVGVAALALLLSNDKSRWILFCLGTFSVAFGYRSIHVGNATYLVPFEIIVFGLWIVLLLLPNKKNHISMPGMLVLVAIWCLIYGFANVLMGIPLDSIAAWTLPLLLGIPVFGVIRRLIADKNRLETINLIFLAVAAFMSVCEIIEFYFPGISAHFPWFFTSSILNTQEGFVRGTFSFWGYPAGAAVIVFGVLIAYDNILRSKENLLRLMSIAILVLGIVAVYVSGTRSAWLGLALAIILLSLSSKLKGIIPLSVLLAASTILPPVFFARADTLVTALNGAIVDTSLLQRSDRWTWGINAIISNPLLGVGYGHWLTHNIFLEIGSTIGVIPAIAFLVFIIQLVIRIARVALNGSTPDARRYGWLFLAIGITWIVQLNVETIFQTPPLAVAFWPILAISWYLPDLFPNSVKKDSLLSPTGSFHDHNINTNL